MDREGFIADRPPSDACKRRRPLEPPQCEWGADTKPLAIGTRVEIPPEPLGIPAEDGARIGRPYLPCAGTDFVVQLAGPPEHEAREVTRVVGHRLDHTVD